MGPSKIGKLMSSELRSIFGHDPLASAFSKKIPCSLNRETGTFNHTKQANFGAGF